MNTNKEILRFSTIGSVDDGKSSLVGRLLLDTKNIYSDHLKSLEKSYQGDGDRKKLLELANLLDGLKAEREQGITIDVAYRYFETEKRRFVIADTPGHEQYTRNMVTGASTSNLSIILIDARKGVLEQTRRHAFIASLLGVPHLLIAVNKMDLVNFSEENFEKIKIDFNKFAEKLTIKDIRFVPVCAIDGDNIVDRSDRTPWYKGESILTTLQDVRANSSKNLIDFRLPIQYVIRPNLDQRFYAGKISSGTISVGEEIMVLPSGKKSKVKSISLYNQEFKIGKAGQSLSLELEDEIDISRGDMLVRSENKPFKENRFEAMLTWLDEESLNKDKVFYLKHTSNLVSCKIDNVNYKLNISNLERNMDKNVSLNEIARVSLTTIRPIYFDTYQKNRNTGSFILIDSITNKTVGAGMIIHRNKKEPFALNSIYSENQNGNITPILPAVTREEREKKQNQKAKTIWLTGLSGSGKSTIARVLDRKLTDFGKSCYLLDGDNTRLGINGNLGFSDEDRSENIRRVAEVAKLLNDAGIIVIASFISPFEKDRINARKIIGDDCFDLVYLSTSLEECERRDPKGLYKKARSGEIANFTGVSSRFEGVQKFDLELNTEAESVEECVEKIIAKCLAD